MERKRGWSGRLLRVLPLLVLMVFLSSVSVTAASNKTVTMTKDGTSWVYTGIQNSVPVVFHKFTVTKPSIVAVAGFKQGQSGSTYGISVKLCKKVSGKMKSLERTESGQYVSQNNTATYALLKGTYYIKVSGVQSYSYRVVAAVSTKAGGVAIKDTGGASSAKAATLKKGTNLVGVIGIGEKKNKTDWYKFNVTKSQVLHLYVEAAGDSGVTFTLFGPSYPNGITIASNLKDASRSAKTVRQTQYGTTVGDLSVQPGTYKIKVARGSYYKKAGYSALYAVRWS